MPNQLNWYVGNRNPSIAETITVDGTPFDLTNSTVKFKARVPGSSTLAVDASATIVTPLAGTVRYDWTASDASTGLLSAARNALVWWEVTTSGKTQDVGEALIQVLAHGPVSTDYVEFEEFKATLELSGMSFADADIKVALASASRAIDEICDRRFYLDVDANQVRYYSPSDPLRLEVDDIVTVTTLKTDETGDGVFETTWTANTDYVREPLNAAADSEPWTVFRVHPSGRYLFPTDYPRSVEITGKFGWPAVPSAIKQATTILAHRLLKRAREVPFGVSAVGLDGSVVRIMAQDPDVLALVKPYADSVLVA